MKMNDPNIINEFTKRAIKAEEDCVIQILQIYLGRIPTIEDFKKCERCFQQGCSDWYYFKYDGVLLGRIEYVFEQFSVKFIPEK